jgi:NAD(P)-dependent dehydrogenase (short-subunit alcohol dehydrogenase family)
MTLENKTVVVIGALGLIGKPVVETLLQAGATVVAGDVNEPGLDQLFEQAESDRLKTTAVDILKPASITSLLDASDRVDALVNLAYPKGKNYGAHFLDVKAGDFKDNVGLHLGGYFNVMQQCVRYSLDRELEFSLVQFASIYGFLAPRFDLYEDTGMTTPVEYAAIKAAILQLNRYITTFTKGSEFRSNCISPGGIFDDQDPRFLERYRSYSRTKGMLEPDDLVGAVVFLCSAQSRYICGQNIVVDDGFSS